MAMGHASLFRKTAHAQTFTTWTQSLLGRHLYPHRHYHRGFHPTYRPLVLGHTHPPLGTAMDNYYQSIPGYSSSVAAAATASHYKIVDSKSFHHDNLILQLCYDTLMDIYIIQVIRVNTRESFSFWGMWPAEWLDAATKKFNSIVL
jgi:hypothetical protein